MTNKEAQITINAIKFMLDHAQYSDDVEEALNMAIDALTAKPEERTKTHACDLIDRQALIKEFSDFVRASNNSDFAPKPTWNDAVSLVKSMPSAQQDLQPTCNNLATDSISRQDAIDALDGEINITGRTNAEAVKGYVRLVKDRLERLPSAQPEIIRCKDCKWSDWYTSADGKRYCYCMETGNGGRTENDFCSYAEEEVDDE